MFITWDAKILPFIGFVIILIVGFILLLTIILPTFNKIDFCAKVLFGLEKFKERDLEK